MKTRFPFIFLVAIVTITSLISCDKYHAKKLAGTYSCRVDYHYWDMTPTTFNTSYFEDIEIEQDGKDVFVLGYRIHIDNLWKEKVYKVGNIHNYLQVQFKDRHISITRSSGGLGGNGTYTYYGERK
jgi:hypothetical protein